MRRWKKRWFRLVGHQLYYFVGETETTPKGVIDLIDCIIVPVSPVELNTDDETTNTFCFEICAAFSSESTMRNSYLLRCASSTEMIRWIIVIREAVVIKPTTIIRQSVAPPELLGIMTVTVRTGESFPTNCGYNLSLSLENEYSRQQKITNYRAAGSTPEWNEHFTFVVWSLDSNIHIRLAIRKRVIQSLYLSSSTFVSMAHSISLKPIAEGARVTDGWFELKKEVVQADPELQRRSTASRLSLRRFSQVPVEIEPARINLRVQYHEVDSIVQHLLDKYHTLRSVLMTNKYALALLLSHAISCKNDEVIYAVTRIYLYEKKCLSLISWFLHIELERALDTSTLFRGDSVLTKLVSTYSRYMGSSYRRKVLNDILMEICKDNTSYEVDKSRLSADVSIDQNVKRLTRICTQIMDSILHKQGELPSGIQIVLRTVHAAVTARFPGYSTYKALSSFFFLRFLSPAIVGPTLLYEDIPFDVPPEFKTIGTHARRTLVLVGKILQSLVNEAGVGQKEAFMTHFDAFIDHYRLELRKFYDEIVFPKEDPLQSAASSPNRRGAMRHSTDHIGGWNYDSIQTTMSGYSSLKGLFDLHNHLQKSDIYRESIEVTNKTVASDLVSIHRFVLDAPFPEVRPNYRMSVYETFGMEEAEQMRTQGQQQWKLVITKLKSDLLEDAAQLSRIHLRVNPRNTQHVSANATPSVSNGAKPSTTDLAQLQLLVSSIRIITPTDPLSVSPRFSLSTSSSPT
eukprot:TRINITY_DN8471_c0_g1_i1.p1 TRINITY_DN8471_c0_g1~~TRINITY_DN8471_c0_g1_i1.p1  ORF type:complete len:742 (-),score=123.21 TRINITY_DN8471_c0_g1_i1:155-2380(-)